MCKCYSCGGCDLCANERGLIECGDCGDMFTQEAMDAQRGAELWGDVALVETGDPCVDGLT